EAGVVKIGLALAPREAAIGVLLARQICGMAGAEVRRQARHGAAEAFVQGLQITAHRLAPGRRTGSARINRRVRIHLPGPRPARFYEPGLNGSSRARYVAGISIDSNLSRPVTKQHTLATCPLATMRPWHEMSNP